MKKFTFWYKKEVEADNIVIASRRAQKIKPKLDDVHVDDIEQEVGFISNDKH